MVKFARAECFFLSAVCLLAVVWGCGKTATGPKDRARVSGKITLSGQPLPAGTLVFESASGPVKTPVMITDGTYSTDRAPVGKNRVTVDTTSIQVGNPAAYVPIPAKYQDASTSGLTVDVQAGNNDDVNFVLEK